MSRFNPGDLVETLVISKSRGSKYWLPATVISQSANEFYNLELVAAAAEYYMVAQGRKSVAPDKIRPLAKLHVGDRVRVDQSKNGSIRWIGCDTQFGNNSETRYGVELDEAIGISDGTWKGKRFFQCKPWCAMFLKERERIRLVKSSQSNSRSTLLKKTVLQKSAQSDAKKALAQHDEKDSLPAFSRNEAEEEKELRKTFNFFDTNKDKRIDAKELKNVMKQLGSEINDAGVQVLLKDFDLNNNGTIEWDEFLKMMKQFGIVGNALPPKEDKRTLTYDKLPVHIRNVRYAVRGPIVQRSLEIAEALKLPGHGKPFSEVVFCNVGNPQALDQKPITFHRQVLSLITNPELLNNPQVTNIYADDVVKRARAFEKAHKIGSYSNSKGITLFREMVAQFIKRRDGPGLPEVDIGGIFLTDGASPAVKTSMSLLIGDKNDGVLIPIPQYPLYSATLTNLRGTAVGYYLREEDRWAVTRESIEEAISNFKKGYPEGRLKAIVVINPGNPTGNVMKREMMEEVVRLCEEHGMLLLADEVYQENIWGNTKWVSFRKVVLEMGSKVELMSFNSISKGFTGECGLRGGYLQGENIDSAVANELYKMFSISLCANTVGQAMIASILNPPASGEPSYNLFVQEREEIKSSLQRKAVIVSEMLNSMTGVSSQPVDGAMYAFPSLTLPEKAKAAARSKGQKPDEFYCFEMLEHTGVVTVAGSGFHQKPGTYHYRITILPKEEKFKQVMERIAKFHEEFLRRYSDDQDSYDIKDSENGAE